MIYNSEPQEEHIPEQEASALDDSSSPEETTTTTSLYEGIDTQKQENFKTMAILHQNNSFHRLKQFLSLIDYPPFSQCLIPKSPSTFEGS